VKSKKKVEKGVSLSSTKKGVKKLLLGGKPKSTQSLALREKDGA